ncbi:MAG: hypothetical protein ABIP94_03095 [Planctomycetota bacterium]
MLANALERMAFVITEPVETEPHEVLDRAEYHAAIDIDGAHVRGYLVVSATDAFVREVAANLVGVDVDAPQAQALSATAAPELANVFGGELIRISGGDSQPFRLGLPRVAAAAEVRSVLAAAENGGGFACVLAGAQGLLHVAARWA